MNLVIADDHDGVRSRVTELICEAFPGARLEHAANGTEVLQRCLLPGCDALIMDIRMPGNSGIEVLRMIRESSSIPVILISTYPCDQYSNAAIRAGANVFIPKEALGDKLVPALRQLLSMVN
jgi:DNA-binding NarL/FixJ family response regulator